MALSTHLPVLRHLQQLFAFLRLLLWLTALVVATPLAQAQGQVPGAERVALVVGMADYQQVARLANPENDARAVSGVLKTAGFSVVQKINASSTDLRQAMAQLERAAYAPATRFIVFYFSGHGAQIDGRNFLMPVDMPANVGALQTQAVDFTAWMNRIAKVKDKTILVILDACRDDPLGKGQQLSKAGLGPADAPPGALIAYATAPGRTASDGSAQSSSGLYTGFLVRELTSKGARLEDAFKRTRLAVRLASSGQQIPWESTSLEEAVYLFPSGREKLSDDQLRVSVEAELKRWNQVKLSLDIDNLAAFIREYPSGVVSELAQSRLNRLLNARFLASEASSLAATQAVAATAALPPGASAGASPGASPNAAPAASLRPQPVSGGSYGTLERVFTEGDFARFEVMDALTRAPIKRTLQTIAKVDTDNETVTTKAGSVYDFMGNVIQFKDGSKNSLPRQFYPADLQVGARWVTEFDRVIDGISYRYNYKVVVVGKERVTVPAGDFDTYKIEATGFGERGGAGKRKAVLWVAPGINVDIAQEFYGWNATGKMTLSERLELTQIRQAYKRTQVAAR